MREPFGMKLPASGLIGWGVVAVAAVVMTGWLLREPAILRAVPGTLMVFNTALCFALAGLALGAEGLVPEARLQRLRTVLGTVLILVSALVLAEYLSGRSLGIDWPQLHRWLTDDNPHPGRMAAPAAAAFMCVGAALVLLHRVRAAWQGVAVQGLALATVTLAAIGIAGQALRFALIFADYPFGPMALHTAAGFVALSVALWLCARRMAWYRSRTVIEREDRRIAAAGAGILALIVCAYAIGAFAVTMHQLEDFARSNLLAQVNGRVDSFRTTVEYRTTRAAVVATRPAIAANLAALQGRPDDAAARRALQAEADSALQFGFSGIAFHGLHGARHAAAGRQLEDPALVLPIAGAHRSALLWDDGFVLYDRVTVSLNGEPVGVVVSEQRLEALTRALGNADDFAASAEIVVCRRLAMELDCVRQRPAPSAFQTAFSDAMPMAHALAGEQGVAVGRDYRERFVIAAYAPIGATGLAMVIKMDTAELYAPVRRQLLAAVLLLVVLAALGAWLLRLRVAPLVRRLAADEERLSLALDGSRLALWDFDVRSGRIYLDEQWSALLGKAPAAVSHTPPELEALVHPDDLPALRRHLQEVLEGKATHYDIEHRVRKPSGDWMWIRSRGRVVARDGRGRALRLAGTNADIEHRKRLELELAHQAGHDALSGLPNRNLFHDRMQRAIARSRRNRTLMAAMYLDIDRFKRINDSFGHDAGDALIRGFAKRLSQCIRDTDTAARLGGDEFAVILEALDDRAAGERIAGKIVAAMRAEFDLGEHRLAISTSLGVAFYQGEEESEAAGILKAADEALYRAKAAGRDTWRACMDAAPPAAPDQRP